MENQKIYIVGAGIAGLVAAIELEKLGFSPVIFESSNAVGGRIKTDSFDGFLLDHGFQVLNTAYPEAKKYLDFTQLKLKNFDSGAVIFEGKNRHIITDPLRNPLKIIEMAYSKVGTFLDKIKIFKLTQELKKKSNEAIFEEKSIPTIQYLKNYGFSDRIIHNFFKPFFRGIFLEKNLSTSSRMFEFIFKMFAFGNATVPSKGMGEIPKMLQSQLNKTKIFFGKSVREVEGKKIFFHDGEILLADRIIVATQPDRVMPQLLGQFLPAQKVVNLYFYLHKSFLQRPIIGLVAGEDFLINNLVFLNEVSPMYAPTDKALLSVTVLEFTLDERILIKRVRQELEQLSGIKAEDFNFLKSYFIEYALPCLDDQKYSIPSTECKIIDDVFLAGDYLLNGSINAAMTSGRIAAEAVAQSYLPTH